MIAYADAAVEHEEVHRRVGGRLVRAGDGERVYSGSPAESSTTRRSGTGAGVRDVAETAPRTGKRHDGREHHEHSTGPR
jgi:hypothetical protein